MLYSLILLLHMLLVASAKEKCCVCAAPSGICFAEAATRGRIRIRSKTARGHSCVRTCRSTYGYPIGTYLEKTKFSESCDSLVRRISELSDESMCGAEDGDAYFSASEGDDEFFSAPENDDEFFSASEEENEHTNDDETQQHLTAEIGATTTKPLLRCSVSRRDDCYYEPSPPSSFKVRGPNYGRDGKKIVPDRARFDLIASTFVAQQDPQRRYFVVRMYGRAGIDIALTFARNDVPDADFDADFDAFRDAEDDAYRNDRFKLLFGRFDASERGSMMTKIALRALGSLLKPMRIARDRKVNAEWETRGRALYLSLDFSRAERMDSARKHLKDIVFEIGFTLEGETPERLVGSVGFRHMQLPHS